MSTTTTKIMCGLNVRSSNGTIFIGDQQGNRIKIDNNGGVIEAIGVGDDTNVVTGASPTNNPDESDTIVERPKQDSRRLRREARAIRRETQSARHEAKAMRHDAEALREGAERMQWRADKLMRRAHCTKGAIAAGLRNGADQMHQAAESMLRSAEQTSHASKEVERNADQMRLIYIEFDKNVDDSH